MCVANTSSHRQLRSSRDGRLGKVGNTHGLIFRFQFCMCDFNVAALQKTVENAADNLCRLRSRCVLRSMTVSGSSATLPKASNLPFRASHFCCRFASLGDGRAPELRF